MVPLLPASIPGLLSLSPEFRLNARVTYHTDMKTAVEIGFDYAVPFRFKVQSKNNAQTIMPNPHFTPILKLPQELLKKPTEFNLDAHLIPKIAVPVKVLGHDLALLSFNFDNSIGFKIEDIESPDCKVGMTYHRGHELFFRAGVGNLGATNTVWNRTHIPIECSWCKKCLESK